MVRSALALVVVSAAWAPAVAAGELAPPVRLEADGKVIDVDVGHAAPFVVDWDGDGRPDLLVGQFGDGRLRIHRRVGDAGAARLDAGTWFEAGGAVGTVPSG